MVEQLKFSQLGQEDFKVGTSTFDVRLADGRIVALSEVNAVDLVNQVLSGSNPFDDIITKGPWVDVRAYGAVGDGSTDNTTAFQDAIDDAISGSGIVFIPAASGTYNISSALTIPNGTDDLTIICASGSFIKMTGNDYALKISDTDTSDKVNRIRIIGLDLQGNGASAADKTATPNNAGIFIGESAKVSIEYFRVTNFINGIYFDKNQVLDEISLEHGRISQIYERALQNRAGGGMDSLYMRDIIIQGSGHGGSSSGQNATIELEGIIDFEWNGGEIAGNHKNNGTPTTSDNYRNAMRLVNSGGHLSGLHFESNGGDIANTTDLRLEGSSGTGRGLVINGANFQGNNANAAKYAIHTGDSEGVTIVSPSFNNGATKAYDYGILMGSNNDQLVIINPMDATPGTSFGTSMIGVANGAKYQIIGKTNQSTMDVDTMRYLARGGTALDSGDFSLHANWGSTASVGSISGNDTRGRFTVTSSGTGQGASPTITITFSDGAFNSAPFAIVRRNGGDQTEEAVAISWTTTTTTLVITFAGTPVDTETYTFEFIVIG